MHRKFCSKFCMHTDIEHNFRNNFALYKENLSLCSDSFLKHVTTSSNSLLSEHFVSQSEISSAELLSEPTFSSTVICEDQSKINSQSVSVPASSSSDFGSSYCIPQCRTSGTPLPDFLPTIALLPSRWIASGYKTSSEDK